MGQWKGKDKKKIIIPNVTRPFSETYTNVGSAYYKQQSSIHCTLLKNILSVHTPGAGYVNFELLDSTDIILLGVNNCG